MYKIAFLIVLLPSFLFSDELLTEHLFAVHATHVLPDDGILHAGYGKPEEYAEGIPDIRCTVHFSIGELVRPVGKDWMSWENKPYAVVTPLRCLYPQLVNLNCYDSFILGDLDLTEEMFIVAPKNTCVNSRCTLFEYEAPCTLREAVDALIASQGGWKVTMIGYKYDDKYRKATVDGVNINTHEFFAPLLSILPHLSLGLRWDSYHGEAWRFARWEMCAMELIHNPESESSWKELEEHKSQIANTYLNAHNLAEKSKIIIEKKIIRFSLLNPSLKQ